MIFTFNVYHIIKALFYPFKYRNFKIIKENQYLLLKGMHIDAMKRKKLSIFITLLIL